MIEIKKNSWDKINIDTYTKLKNLKISDDSLDNLNNNITLLSILCECDEEDIINLTTDEFKDLLNNTSFLHVMPKVKIQNKYIINGNEYEVFLNLKNMTVAQYLDFQTFIKEQEKYFKELLCVFLIPKGKKYNEGYNIDNVKDEIGEYMAITDAYSIVFFFTLLFQSLISSTVECSITDLKKMKKTMTPQEVKEMEKAIQKLEDLKLLMKNGGGFI